MTRLGLVVLFLAVAAAAESPPATYRFLTQTAYGRSAVTQRADAKSVRDALRLTLEDLGRYFGAAPTLAHAYEDAKVAGAGGATFTVQAQGTAIKGLITCKVSNQGARVAVVFIRADAPAGEWARLTQGDRPEKSASNALPAPAHATLKPFHFADGTGSIGLADGWTTQARSALPNVTVEGPAGQHMGLSVSYTIQTPGSPLARGPTTLVAPFGPPAEAFAHLVPQFSQFSQRQGGPALEIDALAKVAEGPNGRQAVLRYGVTETYRDGSHKHFQAVAQMSVAPLTQMAWMLTSTQLRAPDATFDRDLPLMLQMANAVQLNDALIRQKTGQAVAAQKQWFQGQQAAHRAQVAANDAHNRQWEENTKAFDQRNRNWEDNQNATARRDDNFDELLRGYRTVEDTQTGERRSADLLNIDKIVDDLNEHEPGRYRQIPLRDENDPVRSR